VNVLVAGGFDPDNKAQEADLREFAEALGEAICIHGHVLLNGCQTRFDALIAEAAYGKLDQLEIPAKERDMRIISYVLSGRQPTHNCGTVLRSRLTDWELVKASLYIPEQVQQADVVMLVAGYAGTYRAANWARIAKKPLLPFTAFGGAASRVYDEELNEFDKKYSGLVDRRDYEQLNSLRTDWKRHADTIVALAEKVAESHSVVVVMSYVERPELVDAYDSFQQVARELGYECARISERNTEGRIFPEILERIRRAAFVIVDLTDLRPNVFYELGYAEGLNKKVIVTAREGTTLPFDVKDIPTIFWNSQKKLRSDLRNRIRNMTKAATPAISTTIG